MRSKVTELPPPQEAHWPSGAVFTSNENTNGLLRQYYPKGNGPLGRHAVSTGSGGQETQYPASEALDWKTPADVLELKCFDDPLRPSYPCARYATYALGKDPD
jgi:hypothetical protein